MKITLLEIKLNNSKQEKDDKIKAMKKMIDSKETELKFQVSFTMYYNNDYNQ